MNRLLLCSLAALLATPTVRAQIPDSIDKAKYQRIYEEARFQSEELRRQAQADLSQAQSLQDELNGLEADLDNVRGSISHARRTISDLDRDNAQLANEIEQSRNRVQRLKRKRRDVRISLDEVTERMRKRKAKMDAIEGNLQGPLRELNRLKNEKQQVGKKLEQAKAQRKDAAQKKSKAEGRLASLKDQKSTTQQQLEFAKGSQQVLRKQIPEMEEQVPAAKQRVQSFNNKIKVEQMRLDKAQKQLDNAKNEAQRKRAQKRVNKHKEILAGLRDQKKEAQKALRKLTKKIAKDKETLAQLAKTIPELRETIKRTQKAIGQQQGLIQDLAQRLRQAGERVQLMKDRMAVVEQEAQALRREIKPKQERLVSMRGKHKEDRQFRQDLEQRLDRILGRLAENRRFIENSDRIISENLQQMDHLDREIQEMEMDAARLRRDIVNLEPTVQDAWDRQARSDEDARLAEVRTQDALAKYEEVVARYDDLLAQAKTQGTRQGETSAVSPGHSAGQRDGLDAGQSLGLEFGTQEGLLKGYLDGLLEGQTLGKEQGYAKGLNAPENYDSGFERGLVNGKEKAWSDARAESYPQGKKDVYQSRTNSLPRKSVVIDNNTGSESPEELAMRNLVAELNGQAQIQATAMTVGGLQPLSDELDSEISSVQSRIETLEDKAQDALEASAPTPRIRVDVRQADCALSYVDFDEACKEAFAQSYEATYLASYKDAFVQSRNPELKSSRNRAISENQNKRVAEGEDFAYPKAFANWEAIGAQEAQNKGFEDGHAQAYAQAIEGARDAEYARGSQEETQRFDTQSVIEVMEARIVPVGTRTLVPEGEFELELDLVNFGMRGTRRGEVQVVVTPITENVVLPSLVSELTSVTAQTQARVVKVLKGRIRAGTPHRDVIRLNVEVRLGDGTTQNVKVITHVGRHLDVKVEAQYNANPRRYKRVVFIPVTLEHTITFQVTNNSKTDTGEKFWAQVSNRHPGLEFTLPGSPLKRLGPGETGSFEIKYKIIDEDLKGQRVQIPVDIKYGGEAIVVDSQVITITPSN